MPGGPLYLAASLLAGAIAAVSGFGIGSVLVPVTLLYTSGKTAIVLVSIPHLAATAVRFLMLRRHVDWQVFRKFGLMSAAGGLAGAFLLSQAPNEALIALFAVLLLFVGFIGIAGLVERFRLSGWQAWLAGLTSGVLGGLVGNQGGIRTAALLGFNLSKESFVATGTAIALIIDAARMPVYFFQNPDVPRYYGGLILVATIGAVAGTFLGHYVLRRIPRRIYRPLVSLLLIVLGASLLIR